MKRSLLLLTVLLPACSGTQPDSLQVIEREGPDGVKEVVSITEEPPPAPWILTEDLVIGVEYGDEDYMLRGPWGLTVLQDGTIILLDSRPLQFRLYDSRGRFITACGREGDGPDDLRYRGSNLSSLRSSGAGEFEYWSRWPIWRQTWNVEGHLISIQTLPDNHPILKTGRPWVLQPFDSGFVTIYENFRYLDADEVQPVTHVVVRDWGGTVADTIATIETEVFSMPMSASMAQAESDYTPSDVYLVTSTGGVYFSGLLEDWIRVYGPPDGREIMRYKWEHEPDAIPQSLIERYREREIDDMVEGYQWLRDNVYLIHLVEGPEGEVWVQRTGEPDLDGLWPTDVFSESGVYRGRLLLPFAPRQMKVHGDYLYAVGRNGEAPALIRYRLKPAG